MRISDGQFNRRPCFKIFGAGRKVVQSLDLRPTRKTSQFVLRDRQQVVAFLGNVSSISGLRVLRGAVCSDASVINSSRLRSDAAVINGSRLRRDSAVINGSRLRRVRVAYNPVRNARVTRRRLPRRIGARIVRDRIRRRLRDVRGINF